VVNIYKFHLCPSLLRRWDLIVARRC